MSIKPFCLVYICLTKINTENAVNTPNCQTVQNKRPISPTQHVVQDKQFVAPNPAEYV